MSDEIETNSTRAEHAAGAIAMHTVLKGLSGEAAYTRARDLLTDVCHFLRLRAGLAPGDVDKVVNAAVDLFHVEVETDADGPG